MACLFAMALENTAIAELAGITAVIVTMMPRVSRMEKIADRGDPEGKTTLPISMNAAWGLSKATRTQRSA